MQHWQEAKYLSEEIYINIANNNLGINREIIYSKISLANNLVCLNIKADNPNCLKQSECFTYYPAFVNNQVSNQVINLLEIAIAEAEKIDDKRALSNASGSLGRFYEYLKQGDSAQQFTNIALGNARIIEADDLIYQWDWQLGRILFAKGEMENAIAFYENSVQSLKNIRGDLVNLGRDVQFDFRDQVEPLYRRTVDLLIQSADSFSENNKLDQAQERLKKARDVIEQLQLAELENFFKEACIEAKPKQIDTVDPNAAIIYTIILPDRLEVIVSMSKQTESKENKQEITHYSKVSKKDLEASLYRLLQKEGGYIKSQEQDGDGYYYFSPDTERLYDWIIEPVEEKLQKKKIKTLVFVLDGSLRNLPMAVLHDKKENEYLIQKYEIALTPGLQLLKSQPLSQVKLKALIGGASFKDNQLVEDLENVEEELNSIETKVNSKKLFERDFTEKNLAAEIKDSPFTVVHLATHGKFSSNLEDTFIRTSDKRLNANKFSKLFRNRKTGLTPIELLVLSACETAKGDLRAGLGLSGIAIRSEVRSTIASLWTIDDQFTAEFMIEFYKNLKDNPTMTKAEILRQTQLNSILSQKLPMFWAPFVLVGNWN